MKNLILKYSAIMALLSLAITGCDKGEKGLLEPKVYFEQQSTVLEVAESDEMTYHFVSRISNVEAGDVSLSFAIGDKSYVDAYNSRYGTEYDVLDPSQVKLEQTSATIKGGQIYSEQLSMKLTNLNSMTEGKVYLVPLKIESSSAPIMGGSDMQYIIIRKPIRITKAVKFGYNYWLKLPMPADAKFSSVTYEALVYADHFMDYNPFITTIMGREGVLMLRFGDTTIAKNQVQIAGGIQFFAEPKLDAKKWNHIAFTYDKSTKKGIIYINAQKVAEMESDVESFDLSNDMFVGKLAGFMWGERPFYGYMSEVRVWSVARSQNELKQNMLLVDPKTPGLYAYYKLNGSDIIQENGEVFIKDQSPRGMNAISASGHTMPQVDDIAPVEIK